MKLDALLRLRSLAGIALSRDQAALAAIRSARAALGAETVAMTGAESRRIEAALNQPEAAEGLGAWRLAAERRRIAICAEDARLSAVEAEVRDKAAAAVRRREAVTFLASRAEHAARRKAAQREEAALADLAALRARSRRA